MSAPIDVSNSSRLSLIFRFDGDSDHEYTMMINLSDKVKTTLQGFFPNHAPDTPHIIFARDSLLIYDSEKTWLENQCTKNPTPEHPEGLISVAAVQYLCHDETVLMFPNLRARVSTIPR
jgi:hypothetical protein